MRRFLADSADASPSVLALVLGKLKLLLPLLKLAKFSTFLTMLLAVWLYAQIWGFPFAIGFVLLIFVHEMGHALVMMHQGIHAGAPVFIPFVGAVIAMKSMPRNAYIEALVGIVREVGREPATPSETRAILGIAQ